MTIAFPRALLREASHSWNLTGVAVGGGVTSRSVSSLVRTDGGGFWSCAMSDISLSGAGSAIGRDRQKLSTLLWRAVRQICNGGINAIVMPRNDSLFRPWPPGVAQKAGFDIDHGDGSIFDDGSAYYQPVIDITADAADLRSTELDVTINYASELVGGESFSILHDTMDWRLYEIATVEYTSDNVATITFNPPLREAIAAGTFLEFDRPRCRMRLAGTSSMDLSVQPWTFNRASVDFVEAP